MSVKLHASRIGKGAPMLLLHGLFGAGNNLGAVARSLQDRYEVFCLDLPNHGRSDWLAQTDLSGMAACIRDWMTHHDLRSAHLLGHSLGGKVAMQLALTNPDRVRSLQVADIAPVAYPAQHDAVFAALDAVEQGRCGSRQEAAELMALHLKEKDVIQFLLMSLQRGPEGVFDWRFNLEGIRSAYSAVRDAPQSRGPYLGPVQFIKGGDSAYIRESHRQPITALFPQARLKIMPGCGHWLHAQQPALFNSIVSRFLDTQVSPAESSD